ncbi:hypothetical protein SAMN05443287_106222 [Micromonospora phaseoli]|uniref:Uncharacterized protein n=1 Tax=Micromonospora phaseoli TaxID=1144548 RepID=A0A1H7ALU0_9ACTN|nr:DUF5818 domain-containing protein [Micromonospora phaseoli]PZV96290.1 hypothetical protein CLV64_107167 [Micromonospora phaseoli]GIJ75966.1 hypothetical protein Xph01_03980 [Micromonospora phaseoli]SEJ66631.1 hypothetical protein SAMN05443287_106222 [Micromonospora phaseoli]
MPTTVRVRVPAALLTALLVLAGCGDRSADTVTAEQSPTGQPPDGRTNETLSPTEPPLIGTPTAPPSQPTELRKSNVLAGRLSRGGDGPCYTLVTDDGREYALHGADHGTFATGSWVRVTTGPATADVDCGPGIPVSILKISPVG